MFLLPKGIPLAENVHASRIDLPAVLGKLRNGSFNGYAQVSLPLATGVFLYIDGRLISALFQREASNSLRDIDAIQATIESLVLTRDGYFCAYRFNKDITFAMLALFRGDLLLNAQEMKLIDFRAVLEKIKTERMNACLKVYTDDTAGLIFYRDGAPIGFYHDTAREIGLSQAEVQRIAGLPGARIDVQTIKDNEVASTLVDLNDLMDFAKALSLAKENVFSTAADVPAISQLSSLNAPFPAAPSSSKANELQAVLIEIAVIHLGKLGRILMEKELAKAGDSTKLLVPEYMEKLLVALENGSKLLTSPLKIRQMQDSMRAEVARYS
jgi:hypothetical protein